MINCTSTLPIRPRNNPFIGYYSIHVIADIISRINHMPFLYPINLLGMIAVQEKDVKIHLDNIMDLKIIPNKIIKDSDLLKTNIVEKVIKKGLEEGWIIEESRRFYSCSCGKTEFIEEMENLFERKSKRTVYKIINNTPICNFCNSEAVMYDEIVLLLKIPVDILLFNQIIFIQDYFEKDLKNQLKELRGKDILISRKRSRGVSILLYNKLFYMDIDFIYMIYLYYLYEMGFYVDTFIIGSKIAKQTAMSLIVSSLMNIQLPNKIVAIPYLSFTNDLNISTFEFLTLYGGKNLRLILSTSFGANKKELNLNSSFIYQAKQSLNNKNYDLTCKKYCPLDFISLWQGYSVDKIMRLVSSLRKPSINLSEKDKLLLEYLIG